jgi:hypothetical protein
VVISLRLHWKVLYFQCIESRRVNRQFFAGLFQSRSRVGLAVRPRAFSALVTGFASSGFASLVAHADSCGRAAKGEGHSGRVPLRTATQLAIGYFSWPIVAFTLPATDGGSGA